MRVGRNSLLLGGGEMVGLALGFLTTILVTDRTGDDYGLLIGAQRYVALFMVLVQFGLYPLLVRAFAAERAEAGRLLGTVLLVRLLLAGVLALVVPITAGIAGYLPDSRWLLLAWLLIETLGVVAETYMAMCEGLERMGRSAAIAIARSFATFAAVVGVTWMGGGLREYVVAYVCARALQVGVAVVVGHRALPGTRLRFDLSEIGPMIHAARWYAAMGLASAIQGSLPVLVLSRLAGAGETALFGAALNFLDVVMVLPLLIQRALLPAFSRLAVSGGAAQVAHYGLRLIPAALIPAAVGLGLLSGPVVALYPSGEFGAAAPVLSTIALWLLVVGPGNVAGTFLTGLGRMRALVLTNGAGIVVQLAGQLLLVPRYGAVGAAAATLVAYAVVAFACVLLSRGESVVIPWSAWGRSLLAAGVMGAVVWPLRGYALPIPVGAGALVYVTTFALLLPRDALERRLVAELRARWR
jgi:O-antigen/teichoic acid export membrane protein